MRRTYEKILRKYVEKIRGENSRIKVIRASKIPEIVEELLAQFECIELPSDPETLFELEHAEISLGIERQRR